MEIPRLAVNFVPFCLSFLISAFLKSPLSINQEGNASKVISSECVTFVALVTNSSKFGRPVWNKKDNEFYDDMSLILLIFHTVKVDTLRRQAGQWSYNALKQLMGSSRVRTRLFRLQNAPTCRLN